jgi:predicted Zn-dependent protease with MMP-like domain
MRLSPKEFDRAVNRAVARLPGEIRDHLENVLISAQRRPSRSMLAEMGLSPEDAPLGLYVGTSLQERSATAPPLYPDTILIFQEPLERSCATMADLEDQIEITVVHEVAHFFGISEERLADLGYE